MPLDLYLAGKAGILEGLTWGDLVEGRFTERFEQYAADPAPWEMPDVAIEDVTAPGPHGDIPIRVFRGGDDTRGLLWVHGGGFRGGSLDMPESFMVASEIASRCGIAVASVDYRLAVDGVRFPIPLDDVLAAWRWLTESRTWLTLALGGASAGGALSLAATLRLRDDGANLPDGLLLAYPVVHFPVPALDDESAAEMRELPALLRFPAAAIEEMFANYVGSVAGLPALAAPGHADLTGLPPVRVIVSELDDLRPSGELLVRQLRTVHVDVDQYMAVGMPHGHLNRTPALPEVDRSLAYLAQAMHSFG